jgi:tetratricopeptide (TPR) repeat protein
LWQWQLNPGFISDREQGKLDTQTDQSFSDGYDLIYSSISYGGMSGGPVFDIAGNVIGIHGRAESTDLNSLGISTQTFTGLLDKLRVNPRLLKLVKTNPVDLNSQDLKNILVVMQNISQPQAGDNGERWLAYGNQLYRTRQFDKSVAAFDLAIDKKQKLQGNYSKSLSLVTIGKYQLAESAISQAIVAIPSQQTAYYYWKYKSAILRKSEKYDEALKAIDTAILLHRSFSNGLDSNDLTLLNEKAAILINQKQYAAAISVDDEIIRKQPQTYSYNNRGVAKSALGNKQDAITDFDRALALNPKFSQAYYGRGLTKSALGNKQDAISDFDRAIVLNPKYAEVYSDRGLAKSDLGRNQDAITDYNRALALNPKYAQAYSNRGIAEDGLGNKQKAISDYDRAIAINPKLSEAYYNRGNAKSDLGNNQEAIADYNQAIVLNPKFAQAYSNRGIAESDLGNKRKAITDFDRAIVLNPKYARAYGSRGKAKFDLGDKQGGITDISKAAELFRQQGEMDLYQKTMSLLKRLQGN